MLTWPKKFLYKSCSSITDLSNAVCRLPLQCLVFEISGEATPPPQQESNLSEPTRNRVNRIQHPWTALQHNQNSMDEYIRLAPREYLNPIPGGLWNILFLGEGFPLHLENQSLGGGEKRQTPFAWLFKDLQLLHATFSSYLRNWVVLTRLHETGHTLIFPHGFLRWRSRIWPNLRSQI